MPRIGRTYLNRILLGLTLILVVAFAAGCGADATPAAPTKEVFLESLVAEAVETQRAETQEALQNAAMLTEVAETSAAGERSVLQAQTLTPTITPTPDLTQTLAAQAQLTQTPPEDGTAQANGTAEGTPLPTLPPLNLPTPTRPSEPTRRAGDPSLGLGAPDWQDTFENSDNWSLYTTPNSQLEVSGGELLFTILTPGSGPAWTISWPSVSNFYLEVLVRSPQTCSGKDRFGLVFRAADPSQGYRYEISCDGMYHMVIFDENRTETVVAWSSSEHLLAGPNQINRLGVWAQGKVVSLHINGAAVAGLPDTEYRTGRFGVVVAAEETQNFTVSFDNLTFWTFE